MLLLFWLLSSSYPSILLSFVLYFADPYLLRLKFPVLVICLKMESF